MKIGILTHQYINNYGAFLQAWALREAIAELFPNDEVQIIDYVNLKHFIINAGGWFRFYKNRESFKDWMEKIKLLAVYGAGECDKRYSEITVNLMPFEWVEMFRNAEFVFTGTFHGAVFSILNRRQFKVYLTNESRIKKVTALLEELGIQNRKMDSKFEFDLESMKNEINYDAVYRVINEKRQSSKQYLKDAIGMAKQ